MPKLQTKRFTNQLPSAFVTSIATQATLDLLHPEFYGIFNSQIKYFRHRTISTDLSASFVDVVSRRVATSV